MDHILTVNLTKPFMVFCIMPEFSGEDFFNSIPNPKAGG
jgi:hypothetical protein